MMFIGLLVLQRLGYAEPEIPVEEEDDEEVVKALKSEDQGDIWNDVDISAP